MKRGDSYSDKGKTFRITQVRKVRGERELFAMGEDGSGEWVKARKIGRKLKERKHEA